MDISGDPVLTATATHRQHTLRRICPPHRPPPARRASDPMATSSPVRSSSAQHPTLPHEAKVKRRCAVHLHLSARYSSPPCPGSPAPRLAGSSSPSLWGATQEEKEGMRRRCDVMGRVLPCWLPFHTGSSALQLLAAAPSFIRHPLFNNLPDPPLPFLISPRKVLPRRSTICGVLVDCSVKLAWQCHGEEIQDEWLPQHRRSTPMWIWFLSRCLDWRLGGRKVEDPIC